MPYQVVHKLGAGQQFSALGMVARQTMRRVNRIRDPNARKIMREMERKLIVKPLGENDLNRTRKARVLGITWRTLQHKLKEYGIDQSVEDSGEI